VLTGGIVIQEFVLLLFSLNHPVRMIGDNAMLRPLRSMLNMAFPCMGYTPASSFGRPREEQCRE
jgi:hypothetical protein